MTLDTLAKLATVLAGIGTFGATALTMVSGSGVQAKTEPSLARQLADGKPWAMAASDGKTGTMILNPDGSGEMKGPPFPITPSWRETPTGLCLNLGFAGEHCVTLRRIDNGYEGLRSGKVEFRLTR